MLDSEEIIVFGLKLNPKNFPKLYDLGLKDVDRIKVILKVLKDYCELSSYGEAARKAEESRSEEISGETVDIFDYPAIYCWYTHRPKNFSSFFEEISEKIWGGNKREALKMMEQYFENKYLGE